MSLENAWPQRAGSASHQMRPAARGTEEHQNGDQTAHGRLLGRARPGSRTRSRSVDPGQRRLVQSFRSKSRRSFRSAVACRLRVMPTDDQRPVETRTVDGIVDRFRARRLHLRPIARDGRLPGPRAGPPDAARGRGRRRQDRARQGPRDDRSARGSSGSSATRASTSTPRSTSGTTRARCSRSACSRRAGEVDRATAHDIFGPEFLIKRPLLQALEVARRQAAGPADRRDRPRRRGVRGVPARDPVRLPGDRPRDRHRSGPSRPPRVVLTSNRTREVHDALKRRCLYHWIDYPTAEKEFEIVLARVPDAPSASPGQVVGFVQRLREADLTKVPGRRRDARLGGRAARARAPASSTPEVVDETLGRRPQVRGGRPARPRRGRPADTSPRSSPAAEPGRP